MKRTGFARPPSREAKQCDYMPRPRAVAVAISDGKARMSVPIPKYPYIRDERLRDMCRAMPCQCCGATGPDAGVTWAHSNQATHGHGRSVKASDVYVAAMCHKCHVELDQGKTETRAEKVARWNAAHWQTVTTAVHEGLWPAGIPMPLNVSIGKGWKP